VGGICYEARMVALSLSLFFGFVVGLKHAFEPDHLAAVSALSVGHVGGREGAKLGAWWGLGHSFSLFVLAGPLVLLEAQIPVAAAEALEFAVGSMVLSLGIRSVWLAFREGATGLTVPHQHGAVAHSHRGPPGHFHWNSIPIATRPLLVGMVHGLAGSGALAALVIPTLRGAVGRLGYVLLFGAGSTLGMAMLSGMAHVPLRKLNGSKEVRATLLVIVGLASIAIGAVWMVRASSVLSGVIF
jgi:hypothetical protein